MPPWRKTLPANLIEDEAHLVTSTFDTPTSATTSQLPEKEGSCELRLTFTCSTTGAEQIWEKAEAKGSYNKRELYTLTTIPITGHSWEITTPTGDQLRFNYDNTDRIEVGPDMDRLGPVQFKFRPRSDEASTLVDATTMPPQLPWQHLTPRATRLVVNNLTLSDRKKEAEGDTTKMMFTFRGDLWRDGQAAGPLMPRDWFKPFYGVQTFDNGVQVATSADKPAVTKCSPAMTARGTADVTGMWGQGGLLATLPDADYSNTVVPRRED